MVFQSVVDQLGDGSGGQKFGGAEGNQDGDMVRTRGGEGGVPSAEGRGQVGVGESQVQD